MKSFNTAFRQLVAQIFKSGSVTYYYSSLFFPRDVRDDIFVFYAYVRTADDLVDAVPQDIKGFAEYRQQTETGLRDGHSENPLIQGLLDVMQKHQIDAACITSFLDSMEADTTKTTYQTYQELDDYMYGSAGVIGLIMSQILSLPEKSFTSAQMQGNAMQLINFIRDIQEDIDLGRQYIPQEDLEQFNLSNQHPTSSEEQEQFCKLVHFEIERYYKLQEQAEEGYQYIPRKYRIPIKTAADMYNWTARQIWKDPMIVFQKKVKPNPVFVLMTALKNILIA
ncbi:MAG: phytoene/squalene synthase family protein [Patescibacteria group bacterium]